MAQVTEAPRPRREHGAHRDDHLRELPLDHHRRRPHLADRRLHACPTAPSGSTASPTPRSSSSTRSCASAPTRCRARTTASRCSTTPSTCTSRRRGSSPPDDGTISVELSIAGRRHNGVPGDLYDGMATVNLLDFDTGAAIDFFATNDKLATVYGRVLFPGVVAEPPADLNRPTYFCIFNELPVATKPGQTHLYRITYDKAERRALVVHRRRGGRPPPRGAVQDELVPRGARPDDREAHRRRPQHQPAWPGSHRRVEPAHRHHRAPLARRRAKEMSDERCHHDPSRRRVLYTAEADRARRPPGPRRARSDGRLEVDLSSPAELGGDGGPGHQP